jgi:hypothetical protein
MSLAHLMDIGFACSQWNDRTILSGLKTLQATTGFSQLLSSIKTATAYFKKDCNRTFAARFVKTSEKALRFTRSLSHIFA